MSDADGTIVRLLKTHEESLMEALIVTYSVAHLDRIGALGIDVRDGVPGIWGHSYVNTYNRWAGTTPADKLRMEGGIATSYFVSNALCSLHSLTGAAMPPHVLREVYQFFQHRSDASGNFGIRRSSARGGDEIDVNLRHTCFSVLTLLALREATGALPKELERRVHQSAKLIFAARSQEELLDRWFRESWPVGGIAAYVAARDRLLQTKYTSGLDSHARAAWAATRTPLLDALASIADHEIELVTSRLGLPRVGLSVHWPWWPPILNREVLRLHSTLGCLELVGTELAKRPTGVARIDALNRQLSDDLRRRGVPAFSDSSPGSIAAAIGILNLVLGDWQDTQDDTDGVREEVLEATLSYIAEMWSNPDAYVDYWSEFTVPLLSQRAIRDTVDLRFVVETGNARINALLGGRSTPPRNTPAESQRLDLLSALVGVTSPGARLTPPA